MNIEQRLKKFQKAYLETEPSQKFLERGWPDLQSKIAHLEESRAARFRLFYARPVVFAAILIFVLGSFVGLAAASTNSLPGELLYPLKRLSENTISLTTGNNLVKVDNRAKEIVKLNEEKKVDRLKEAVEDYKTAVFEATSAGRNKQELEEELEQNEAEFNQTQGTSTNEHLQEAIETSRKGRQEDRSGSNSGKN